MTGVDRIVQFSDANCIKCCKFSDTVPLLMWRLEPWDWRITLQNETDEPSLLIVNFHANKTCPFGLIAHLFIS